MPVENHFILCDRKCEKIVKCVLYAPLFTCLVSCSSYHLLQDVIIWMENMFPLCFKVWGVIPMFSGSQFLNRVRAEIT